MRRLGRHGLFGRLLALGAMVGVILAAPLPSRADDWRELPLPASEVGSVLNNPLKGFYGWYGTGIVPGPTPTEHYARLSWADIEPHEGAYTFAAIERMLATLPPGHRIAFGIMPLNTCCSTRAGLDVPADMPDHLQKGFWIKADPAPGRLGGRAYVPDWNDPYYIQRFAKLYEVIGRAYDGDKRIAWIDIRTYGNWGEGHLAGARGYQSGRIPYDDPSINGSGATPGTLATRTALADAVVKALPRTRLIAMTDDKEVLLHLLKTKTDIPIGMRRDSWGARMFETALIPANLSADDTRLIADRWKIAPFIVESYGSSKVFEAGTKGIVEQIESQHVSAVGNGNFSVRRWADLNSTQQSALIDAGRRAGYAYGLTQIRYRLANEPECALAVALGWRNSGVAPPYEDWRAELWLTPAAAGSRPIGPVSVALPRLLPDEQGVTAPACFVLPAAFLTKDLRLLLRVADASGSRTMQLPIAAIDAIGDYDLGTLSPK